MYTTSWSSISRRHCQALVRFCHVGVILGGKRSGDIYAVPQSQEVGLEKMVISGFRTDGTHLVPRSRRSQADASRLSLPANGCAGCQQLRSVDGRDGCLHFGLLKTYSVASLVCGLGVPTKLTLRPSSLFHLEENLCNSG